MVSDDPDFETQAVDVIGRCQVARALFNVPGLLWRRAGLGLALSMRRIGIETTSVRSRSPKSEAGTAVARFDRARNKLEIIEDIDLVNNVEWQRFVADYRIGIESDAGPPEGHPAGEPAS